MNRLSALFVLLAFVILGARPASSQTDPERATFQGVSWVSGDEVPRIRGAASSTGAFFAQNFYRVDDFSQSIPADNQVFFFRVVQTVRPLSELNATPERVLEIMVDDAKTIAKQLGTADADLAVSDCKRTIGSVERSGQSVSGTVKQGLSDQSSVTGRYECYAYEHAGKGVGVILKLATSDEARMSEDALQADAILSNLLIETVGQLDAYETVIQGAVFKLPVASVLSNVSQPQQGMGIADVQMQGAQARLITAATGYAPNPRQTFTDLRDQYHIENRNTIMNAEGISVLVDRQLRLATGDGHLTLITAPMLVYQNNGELILNTVLSKQFSTSTYASLTVSLADPELAGTIVRTIGSGMQGGEDNIYQLQETRLIPGVRLSIDSSMGVQREPRDGLIEISPSFIGIGKDRIDALRDGKSIISIGIAPEGDTIDDLHSAYVKVFNDQNTDRGDKPLSKLTNGTTHLAPNPALGLRRDWIRTELKASNPDAPPTDDVSISSTLVEYPGTKHRLVVHQFSPTPLRGIELEAAESVILGATVLKKDERHSIGTMELSGELADLVWFASSDSLLHTTTYSTMMGNCRIYACVFDRDPEDDVLSSRLLADRKMRNEVNRLLFADEKSTYPENSEGLTESTVAGHPALVFAQQFTGGDDGGSGDRKVSANVRIAGVRHDKGYTVISIVQEKDLDEARVDEIVNMFVAPED